jgi:NTP pyrophosphatase (non-canonical NTP hydrolase)
MTLNEYQEKAMTTCLPTSNNFAYMMLNLMGEVGEFSSKVAKAIRKGKAMVERNEFYPFKPDTKNVIRASAMMIDEDFEELQKEAGDILWQLSGLCKVMGWSLDDIAQQNLAKLADRKERKVIDGNGDDR